MRSDSFGYLGDDEVYLDCACQTLRPEPVIKALNEYYREYNSCGERVKYAWGKKVDTAVEDTRDKVLKFLKLSPRDYFTSFTLNTTYGINLILNQLDPAGIKQVVTTDIEHNSPFLSTIAFARRHGMPRVVLEREPDGSINLANADFDHALVVVNTNSNIDGRALGNAHAVVKAVHKAGGIIVIDAAQSMAHYHKNLEKLEADAICFSAHKMYSASLGVMVVCKSLLERINITFIGGGMVDDVTESEYVLSANSPQHIYTIFEPGLQAWGEIIALGEAIDWLEKAEKKSRVYELSERLHSFLKSQPGVHLTTEAPSTTMAFYHDKIDAHLLAEGLSTEGIMARSGYFCCHHYLNHAMHYPPLLRFSLGHHNTDADIEKAERVLERTFN
ncbi:MAG: aminotransferase class V-fold PLP-dependent enzyme [Candidatus Nomurabacteria bacterium]|jgi:cysteine desulfurase/selenocysteine lyase|nr:aminotransferase class V-fold PLP-dependent enzyme [Candidatus Nomurabacteria bacterium]